MKRKFFRKIKYLDKRMLAGGIVFLVWSPLCWGTISFLADLNKLWI